MPTRENRPESNPGAATQLAKANAYSTDATDNRRQELARMREAWRRRPRLDCGCTDSCRCDYKRNPSDKRTTAYGEAVEWLAEHKLDAAPLMAEARELWRRGGSDRAVADRVVRGWTA